MKQIIITFLIPILSYIVAHGQVGYIYDESGNRIKREVLKSAEIKHDSLTFSQSLILQENSFAELKQTELLSPFDDFTVTLYPNPTKGMVMVKFRNLPSGEKPVLEIWSAQGRLISALKITKTITRINLHGKPGGAYFFKTILNNQPVTWKIIKE